MNSSNSSHSVYNSTVSSSNLKQKQRLLNHLESERMIAILEDIIEKLSFLSSMVPDVLQHRDELSRFIGNEISKAISEQRKLEMKFEELLIKRSTMKYSINKSEYKQIQEEIHETGRLLKDSTSTVVRNLKENPNIHGNLIKIEKDREELCDLLLRCKQELRDFGTFHTITRKIQEDIDSKQRFEQLKIHDQELSDLINKLQNQLIEEQNQFHIISTEQRKVILQLKDELQILKNNTSYDVLFKRKEANAKISSIWRELKFTEREIETKLKDIEEKMLTENLVNEQSKQFLIRKTNELHMKSLEWDKKYDNDITKLKELLSIKSIQRMELLAKLTILRDRKANDDKLLQEEQLRHELNLKHDMEMKLLNKKQHYAARVLQRCFKRYLRYKKLWNELRGTSKKKSGKSKKSSKKGKK